MISSSPEMQEEVRSRLEQLESKYRRGEIRTFLFAYPLAILSFAVPATLAVAFIVVAMMPRFGQGVGILMGCLAFVMLAAGFESLVNKFTQRPFRSSQETAVTRAFDNAFPVENEEEREVALDILDQEFEKYSIAKMIVGSPTGVDLDVFGDLFMATGQMPVKNEVFAFQCDSSLLERGTIKALTQYGHRLQALTTGEFKRETQAQERFVRVHKREEDPSTQPERIWRTYQDTVRWQEYVDSMDDSTLSEYLRSYPYVDEKSQYIHRILKGPEPESEKEDDSHDFSEEQT
jgi:uncharacterized protein YifE (UPF0438 family)